MTEPVHIIADYVRRLRWSLQAIPAEDRDGLVREIESHLTDSLAAGPIRWTPRSRRWDRLMRWPRAIFRSFGWPVRWATIALPR